MDSENTRRNILLIGYRGCGKSTVGRILAAKLDRDFLDIDEVIQQRTGKTIADIFNAEGEPHFRTLESQIIEELTPDRAAVISLGGGAVELDENRQRIRQLGYVVWLTAAPEELHRRIISDSASSSSRPPLTPDDSLAEIRHKLAARARWYESLADLRLDTMEQGPTRIVETIYHHYYGVKSR